VRLAIMAMVVAGSTAAEPRFEPVTDLPAHEYSGGWEHFVGGGVAVLDCNGDLRPDLYVAGGADPARLLVNRSAESRGIAFAEATPASAALTGVTGAYPLDIDGDGTLDLVVLRVGPNVILRGLGDCRFEDATEAFGLDPGAGWTTAFSATWEPEHVMPTLAFGNYVDRDDPEGPFGTCDANALHRPEGDRYGTPMPLEPGYCALSMLFSDWNRSGRQDLRISNDRHYYIRDGAEELWRMGPSPRRWTEAEGWRPMSLWGMGIASRDITGDGLPEVYLTSMGDQILQFRDPEAVGPVWRDAPWSLGATATAPYAGDDGRPSTGWHAEFGDVDNDGRDDLFVAKGNVDQMPDMAMADPNNLLMQQADGTFVEAGLEAGLASPHRGRGAALIDLDLDGRLDVVVVNRRAPLEVWRNVSDGTGNWVAVAVDAGPANRAMVGGRIELRAGDRVRSREITVGGGHAGGQAGFHHVGLGDLASVELRLVTPDGTASAWQPIAPNRHHNVSGPVTQGALLRIETLGF
jgi:enediyne biosynthesis protein E4